ncbi:class I SAM-dependent methyltransferase [Clostridium tarantellae]|uniref:Methyltransferase domain-containing protein n=1 Tax=Clostridium tarantellae TaxID=39493 RepID=A0A6I1MWV2_9CLOT|nr:rRNA adenine N-6-methyltransferase family protein [Clostridium tarantellae]MPQ44629.1 methyltransferase domain-containing protein [Clostridium tarantellae]
MGNFLMEYILNPRTVGAVVPSSKNLAKKMVEEINFDNCQCIVEYGPGTGAFTDELLVRRNENTKIILIEYNKEFYKYIKERYKNKKNLIIINGSAENIDDYLKTYEINNVDYIVSGLPFASLSKEVSKTILNKTNNIIGTRGKFITFQYTLTKKRFFEKYFSKIKIKREFKNIPPAYIIICDK